ncbi:hypothetical protein R3P38DRAFT_3173869 [Favolaschia claudopus]|uniref:Uncharacterized protein n=1 Tax=Favolaschia claudopus TaxID=2862362 RepID=A0AAW0DGQ2_9AGAR
MFSIKPLLFFTTAALFSSAAAQGWEVMVYETSAGGTSSCTGGGTTISGSDAGPCHVVGLGSNAASFNILVHQDPPGSQWVFNLFTDNSCQTSTGEIIGPGSCFSGSVGSFKAQTFPN